MTNLDHLVFDLGDPLPLSAGGEQGGMAVEVTEVALELPVEARIDGVGLALCAPRGRLMTGFQSPHGRLRLSFIRREPCPR